MNPTRRPWLYYGIALLLVAIAVALLLWPLQSMDVRSPWQRIAVFLAGGIIISGIAWALRRATTGHDTGSRRAGEALRRAQGETALERARLQFIFDSVPVGIALNLIHPDGSITYTINETHLRICGITREQAAEGGGFKKISHPDDYKKQMLLLAEVDKGRTNRFSFDKRYIKPDGQTIWVFFSFQRRKYEDGSCDDLTVVVDITARKLLEDAIRRDEENLAVTLNSIGDAVVATDEQGLVTRMNPVAESLTGWTQAAALGRPVAEVFRIVNEETHQPATLAVDNVLATGETHIQAGHTLVVARDGTERPIADSAAPIRDNEGRIIGVVLVFHDVTQERNAERAIRDSEQRLRILNEGLEQRVEQRTAALITTNTELVHEINRRKHAEELLGRLNNELEQRVKERTAALEEANQELEAFSYSVSHDLRAPIRHIQGYVGLLTNAVGAQVPEKARGYMKIIGDSGMEMGNLIDDLLSFSRMSRIEMRRVPVNLDELVRESVQKLEMDTRDRNIAWKISLLPTVIGDSSMLRQVFANLLGNAVKYTRPRDPAEIECGTAGTEEGRVILFVRDNGVGFDMAYAKNLFGVFQRLHSAGEFEGTGIGLANVRRIISRHDGRTWAEAQEGKGATIYFTLKPAETA